ncbi:MAG: hypothetical protein H7X95_03525, partial [Deltaproteobacteria bacterium]|nr:hypothetical protein [Deltaproteobacteria bacterium]
MNTSVVAFPPNVASTIANLVRRTRAANANAKKAHADLRPPPFDHPGVPEYREAMFGRAASKWLILVVLICAPDVGCSKRDGVGGSGGRVGTGGGPSGGSVGTDGGGTGGSVGPDSGEAGGGTGGNPDAAVVA